MPFGLFEKKIAKTHFDRSPELKSVALLINQLREKKSQLALDAKRFGLASKDQRKYDVVASLAAQLDASIAAFNNMAATTDELQNAKDILMIVRQMNTATQTTFDRHKTILNAPRDMRRAIVNKTVKYGLLAAAIIPAVALPMYFSTGIALTATAKVGGDKARNLTGLDDVMPKSSRLVSKLARTLTEIDQNLTAFLESREPAVVRLAI